MTQVTTTTPNSSTSTLGDPVVVQVCALLLASAASFWELASNHSNTALVLASQQSNFLKGMGASNIALLLGIAVAMRAFVVYGRSFLAEGPALPKVISQLGQHEERSLYADLAVKFALLFVIIAGGTVEWFAAAIMLCIGDFLVKQRFFSMPEHIATPLGIGFFSAAIVMAHIGLAYLVIPLCAFAVTTVVSLAYARQGEQG